MSENGKDKSMFGYYKHMWQTYDKSFLVALCLQYFNTGYDAVAQLAWTYRCLNYYQISPAQTTQYEAILALPWAPKIIYGMITDSFPLCGSRKRNYLVVMGILQAASCAVAMWDLPDIRLLVAMMFIMAFANAMMDVVVDGLMVI
jgi:hypothetical protein